MKFLSQLNALALADLRKLWLFVVKHKKAEETAVEAGAIDIIWALLKRAGLVGAGIAAAATLSSSGSIHVAPGRSFYNYVYQTAPRYHVDPAAELAISTQEGGSGGIGDNGTSFGPNQLHAGGALPRSVYFGPYSGRTQAWAWSSTGINYVLKQEEQLCGGLKGYAAVRCIAYRFERSINPARETAGAWANYHYFHAPKPVHHSRAWHLRHLRAHSRRQAFHYWLDWSLGVGKWHGLHKFDIKARPHVRRPARHIWWVRRAAYVRSHH